jgi:hypothetical protein
MVACLYSGPSPVQFGLTETIDPLRAAAIHGKVLASASTLQRRDAVAVPASCQEL